MVRRRDLFNEARKALSSDFEARQLCRFVFGEPDGDASDDEKARFSELLKRRKDGEPLQYILGEWEFYGHRFFVGEGVLIPRQDTETIVDAAIEHSSENPVIIDLCSGSGCIGITLSKELSHPRVFLAERSEKALSYLNRNIELNGADVTAVKCDVLDEKSLSLFPMADMIVCNPPYLTKYDMSVLQREVTFEPEDALFGGDDGLDFYRGVSALWKQKLKPRGTIIYEIGAGQENDVGQILKENGFENITYRKDLCEIIRAVIAEKK